jgi:hypothetical protein
MYQAESIFHGPKNSPGKDRELRLEPFHDFFPVEASVDASLVGNVFGAICVP